jgi:hypothetical protein
LSREAEAKTKPVRPPIVNKNKNPTDHVNEFSHLMFLPVIVANQENILTPVGTAITIVADVK